jgi:hypothetical protein
MIRALPIRRRLRLSGLTEEGIEPEVPLKPLDPLTKDTLTDPYLREQIASNTQIQIQDISFDEKQADLKNSKQTVLGWLVKILTGTSSTSTSDYGTAVDIMDGTQKFIDENVPKNATPADYSNVYKKSKVLEQNGLRDSNIQTKNGVTGKQRSSQEVIKQQADPKTRVKDLNDAAEESRNNQKENADDTLNNKQKDGKLSELTGKSLLKLLEYGIFFGSLFLFDYFVAKHKTDCYLIQGANQVQINCPDYGPDNTNQCRCPIELSSGTELDTAVVEASQSGDNVQAACEADAVNDNIKNCPICAEAGSSSTNCPAPTVTLADGLCPKDGSQYYVWKEYSWLDILGDQANALNDTAGDIFNAGKWGLENIGKIIIIVALLIGGIILVKILSLLFRRK